MTAGEKVSALPSTTGVTVRASSIVAERVTSCGVACALTTVLVGAGMTAMVPRQVKATCAVLSTTYSPDCAPPSEYTTDTAPATAPVHAMVYDDTSSLLEL